MDMKRFFLYAISIAALALAGCGGGGGGTSGPSLQDQLTDALADLETAEGERDAARMALEAVRMALSVMTDAEIAGAIMALDADSAALAAVASELGMTGATQVMLVAEIQRLQTEDMGPVESAAALADAMAIVLLTPSGDYGTLTDARRPGKNTAVMTDDFLVTPGAVATDLKPTTKIGTDNLGVDDMTADVPPVSIRNQFLEQDGATRAGIAGWDGSVHERTKTENNVTVTDTVTVYTNLEDAGNVPYLEYYTVSGRAGVSGAVNTTENDRLALANGEANKAALYSGAGFPTAPGNFVVRMDTAATPANETEFVGAFKRYPWQIFMYDNVQG